ncbi:MAG: DNA-binding protein [Alphaproteobacteria bacterium]|nr:DNA-binding protein [Alphaproteobacteria bacterium]
MALFFDKSWFDARLKDVGATREDIARLLQLSEVQVEEIWKDQRELRAHQVAVIARFLNVAPWLVAEHAGVSTPIPQENEDVSARLSEMEHRLARLERMIVELKARLEAPRN